MTGDGPISLSPNNHRLYIYSSIPEFLSSKPKECHLRSILCFKEEEKVVLSCKKSSKINKSFKLLRVLECRCVNFTSFPYELNMLIHSRYIFLSCDEIDSIPKAISRLRYLETLVVDTKSSSLQFHRIIWKMIQLRHLVTKATIVVQTPREGEVVRYLRTLNRLAPSRCLEILKLKNNAFVGDSWISSDADGFRCLSFLLIATTDLASWEVSSPCFLNLKHLVLKDCEKL